MDCDLNRILRCNAVSFASKFKSYKSFVISILLYGYETWTLLADSEEKIHISSKSAIGYKIASASSFVILIDRAKQTS